MNNQELATKIAEEVFKTIESERGIVKAQIVEAVEKVLAVYHSTVQIDPYTLRPVGMGADEFNRIKPYLPAGRLPSQQELQAARQFSTAVSNDGGKTYE